MKKIYKKILIGSFIFVPIIIGSSYFLINKFILSKPKVQNNNSYYVNVEGAVRNPGKYLLNKPTKIREILFKADLKSEADILSLNLEKIINDEQTIIVPYKIGAFNKLKWQNYNNINLLTSKGIKLSIAQKLLDFRRKNITTTWEQIRSIRGIGETTISQLKELIDLS